MHILKLHLKSLFLQSSIYISLWSTNHQGAWNAIIQYNNSFALGLCSRKVSFSSTEGECWISSNYILTVIWGGVIIRGLYPHSVYIMNLVIVSRKILLTLLINSKDQLAHPLYSWSIHLVGRGSQHLANSKIPEVQKATLSRGTCNPFIQSYMFIFWIRCVT